MTGRHGRNRPGRKGHENSGRGKPKERRMKKTIEDYYFYVGSTKQASDYETTTEFIINHIKKTFDHGNDIAEVLRMLTKAEVNSWEPTLAISTSMVTADKEQEDKQNEIKYKMELDEAIKQKRTYKNNLFKSYALLWERCAKAMQNRLAARADFESDIYNDPIKLLIAIKEHSLNYQESCYEMSIILDSLHAMINLRQHQKENLQDYTRRFKTS